MLYCKKKHLEKHFTRYFQTRKKIKLEVTLMQIKATKNKQLYSYKTNKKQENIFHCASFIIHRQFSLNRKFKIDMVCHT